MKILITGSKGFVGTHLTNRLKKNNEIVSFDLKEGRDILNEELLNKHLKEVDLVIHLAAFVDGNESWKKPETYLINNGLGTYKVIKCAIKNKVKRIIVFSSAAVYGSPLTPYGASKMWAEAAARSYSDQIEIIIVRPFNIYGKGQNPIYGYVINNFSKGITENGKVYIYGTGNQTRDFIYIEDVISIVEKLMTSKVPTKPIDLGTGKETKIKDLAEIIGKILQKKYKINYLKERIEPLKSRANVIMLKEMNFKPEEFTKIEDGLKLLIK
jgi:UDP-glucose 4-epimerase